MSSNDPTPSGGARNPRPNAPDKKLPDPAEELVALERELQALQIAFEQFFIGVERKSPERRSVQLAGRIRTLAGSGRLRSTALKFQMQQLQTKFQTYERMWMRTLQEMEAGTYRRDLYRLRRKQAAVAEKASAAPKPKAPDISAHSPDLSEAQIRQIFDTYVLARQRTNESTAGVTFEGLATTLRKQVPQLLKKHDARAIDFKVVIKDGKAVLRAIPRK